MRRRTNSSLSTMFPLLQLLFAVLVASPPVPEGRRQYGIGTSQGFIDAGKMLAAAMNTSVDPCEDFYGFACGGWVAAHPLPADGLRSSPFVILADRVTIALRGLLSSPLDSSPSKAKQMVRSLYRACMDEEAIERAKGADLIQGIKSLGAWPMFTPDWHSDAFDLTSLLASLSSRVTPPTTFLTVRVQKDHTGNPRSIIMLGPGNIIFGVPGFYENERKFAKEIKAYKRFAFEMAEWLQYTIHALGLRSRWFRSILLRNERCIKLDSVSGAADHKRAILEVLYARIPELLLPLHERLAPEFNDTVSLIASDIGHEISEKKLRVYIEKVFELQKRLSRLKAQGVDAFVKLSELQNPLIDWPRYFKLSAPSLLAYFDADPEVYVFNLSYMKLLKELLIDTDLRVVANYIFLAYVDTYKLELDSRYAEIEQRLRKIVNDKEASEERFKKCVDDVQHLKFATSSLYVEKHFKEDAKAATEAMIEEISADFRELLEGNDWMDSGTRKEALEKLRSAFRRIGYPDWILDEEKLDNYYGALDVLPTDSFAEGKAKVLQWEANFEFGRLLVPVDRFEFLMNPTEINAEYRPLLNGIYLPAGILQPPFFCHGFPLALNYGAIGTIIGHEFTHGFDNSGKYFDGNGDFRDWWETTAEKEFDERSKCFVKLYSSEYFDRVQRSVNGSLTLGENIADNGGIKQSFRLKPSFQACRKHLKMHGPEPRTPLVDQLSNEQLFFVGFAQVYNCPVGSTMNPADRCEIW